MIPRHWIDIMEDLVRTARLHAPEDGFSKKEMALFYEAEFVAKEHMRKLGFSGDTVPKLKTSGSTAAKIASSTGSSIPSSLPV